MKPIKVIDLFAGPGGLGEGFSSLKINGQFPFKIAVSVEKEHSAHDTLTLRAFVREFEGRKPPKEYYQYVRDEITSEELYSLYPKQYEAAQKETLYGPKELGKDNKIIHAAIREATANIKNWILIGGPPCQAYSLVGRARNKGKENYRPETDEKHFLYKEYLQILEKYRPPIFVMENVKGILSSKIKGNLIFDQILNDLRDAGYQIYSFSKPSRGNNKAGPVYLPQDFVIKTEEFGIPQTRHRVILLGIRKDIKVEESQIILKPAPKVALKKVIGRMPKLRSGISKGQDGPDEWIDLLAKASKILAAELHDKSIVRAIKKSALNRTAPKYDRGEQFIPAEKTIAGAPMELARFYKDPLLHGVINHDTRSHIEQDLFRYLYAAAYAANKNISPNLKDFPRKLQPKHANRDSGSFVDRFKVQLANQPAGTVTSHISKDGHYFIHYDPEQCRSLTVREAARIQTFPDNYFFEGNRTQQYVQVGNAVPPYLAKHIAQNIHKIML